MQRAAVPPVLSGIAELAPRYDLFLCDIWGVVHDGRKPHAAATAALEKARQSGVGVILISNAPRPGAVVEQQIARIGVDHRCYDCIVTSGDVARDELRQRPGAAVFHLGPERDLPNYDGLDVRLVDLEQAELVVCTGLFDDTRETPQDYADLLARARLRKLPMLCANPDVVVERGSERVWCAGALAAAYEKLGGEVVYAGKPYPAVYRSALDRAEKLRGKPIAPKRVLAIGDGVHTDLLGAEREGFDSLFVAGGIHAAETGFDGQSAPQPERLADFFNAAGVRPVAVMHRLAW